MADFNSPTNNSDALAVLSQLSALIVSVAKMGIGTSDTNEPEGRTRYNETTQTFQKKVGATWVDFNFHATITSAIAAIASSSSVPPGARFDYAGSTLPSGYLWCDGSAVSRTTYANLFTAIGTTHGVGDGSTTFNLPDCQERFTLGRHRTTGSYQTLGAKGGSLDHTHSIAAHVHTIAGHVHYMAHNHNVNSHYHSIPPHVHLVEAHFHACQGTFNSHSGIYIGGGGAHLHYVLTRGVNATIATGTGSRVMEATGGTPHDTAVLLNNDTTSAHGHDHSQVLGYVGNDAGGRDGDDAFSTKRAIWDDEARTNTTVITGSTGGTTGAITNGPNGDNTGDSGTLSTTAGEGTGTTGSNNPKYIILNSIIKT